MTVSKECVHYSEVAK